MIFLDTNIILRFVLNDHPLYSLKAQEIFAKIDKEEVKVYLSLLVIFETVFVLQNSHHLPKGEIAEKLISILNRENIFLDQKNLIDKVFKNYVEKNISFADSYHAVLMDKKKINKIYSFDRDFDKFPQIKRLKK